MKSFLSITMRGKALLRSLFFVCITFIFIGCSDYLSDTFRQNIVMALPQMPAVVSSSQVIRSYEELESQLTPEELELLKEIPVTQSLPAEENEEEEGAERAVTLGQLLEDIDFEKYSLLLGVGYYGNHKDTILTHSLLQTGANVYEYVVFIPGMSAEPDSFNYGMIVQKLPPAAKVNFRTVIRNEFK
ncbi:MAG: hypothetical protein LUG96_05035 [Tannerellaceae bacterium]|nr:hypothetical protein [Tannerellaceae bacterium]